MNGSLFSLFAFSASGQSPTEVSAGVPLPGNTAPSEPSFLTLLQRHTAVVPAGRTSTDVQSFIQGQASLEEKTLSLSGSVAVLDPEKSGKAIPRDMDTVTLSESPVFNPMQMDDDNELGVGDEVSAPPPLPRFGNGESVYDGGKQHPTHGLLKRVVDDAPGVHVRERGFMNDPDDSSSLGDISQPVTYDRGVALNERRTIYGTARVGSGQTTARIEMLPITSALEYGKSDVSTLSSVSTSLSLGGKESQEGGRLKDTNFVLFAEHQILPREGTKGQEGLRVSHSGVDHLLQKEENVLPRGLFIKPDQSSLPDPQKSQFMLPRSVVIPESSVKSPVSPISVSTQLQGVSGLTVLRPESVGAVVGGTGTMVNESLADTAGTKPDPGKIQSAVDIHGLNSDANGETGLQSGLGGFSHSQNGHQSSPSPPSAPLTGALRGPDEAAPELPPQPIQRLQLEVQISETQRIQIDVGVQHRHVYAGLLMDHMSLRNLAMQFVPQLEEQMTNINMELREFSAETHEEKGAEADSMFQGRKPANESQDGMGNVFPAQRGTLNRPSPTAESGLHLVA